MLSVVLSVISPSPSLLQSHVQESLIKMHQDKEAEWRSKYNQAQDLVRQLQSEIKIDIERKNAENTRLKVRTVIQEGSVH